MVSSIQFPRCSEARSAEQLIRVAGETELSETAIEALTNVSGSQLPEKLAETVLRMIAANHQEYARETIEANRKVLGPQLNEIADRAVPQLIERLGANEPIDGPLVGILVPAFSADKGADLAMAMINQLQAGAGVGALAATDHLRENGEKRFRSEFASRALDALTALGEIGPPNSELLAAVCRNVDLLDPDQQSRMVEKLAAWLSVQPGQATLLAGNIATIEGLKADPAKDLVEALVNAKQGAGSDQHDIREHLLEAAYAIRGHKRSRSLAVLRKRLQQLEDGSDFEQGRSTAFQKRSTDLQQTASPWFVFRAAGGGSSGKAAGALLSKLTYRVAGAGVGRWEHISSSGRTRPTPSATKATNPPSPGAMPSAKRIKSNCSIYAPSRIRTYDLLLRSLPQQEPILSSAEARVLRHSRQGGRKDLRPSGVRQDVLEQLPSVL